MNKPGPIYCDSVDKIPRSPHFAILRNRSIHVPAEGVWAPGHGYPEHTETSIEYIAYFNEEEFKRDFGKMLSQQGYTQAIGITVTDNWITQTMVIPVKVDNKQ